MKKRGALKLALPALVFAIGLTPLVPALRAQTQRQPSGQQEPSQPKGQSFVGQIVKAKSGQYALLVDKQAGSGFYLDDQAKAQKFEGQNVRVIGTLDAENHLIHVSDIQPA